jgi:hypothetical protein
VDVSRHVTRRGQVLALQSFRSPILAGSLNKRSISVLPGCRHRSALNPPTRSSSLVLNIANRYTIGYRHRISGYSSLDLQLLMTVRERYAGRESEILPMIFQILVPVILMFVFLPIRISHEEIPRQVKQRSYKAYSSLCKSDIKYVY